ncbi:MAG: hypothetical protein NXI31_00540 [bacterium]|nr:hypothetical protein [bacterium]
MNRLRCWLAGCLAVGFFAGLVAGQTSPAPLPKAVYGKVAGVLVGADGTPVPAGEELQVRVEIHAPGFNLGAFDLIEIGKGGVLRYENWALAGMGFPLGPGNRRWLHFRRMRDGVLERAYVAVRQDLGTVRLRNEERLVAGRVVDELGAAVLRQSVRVNLAPVAAHDPGILSRLQPRVVLAADGFEIWGFRAPGEFVLSAGYVYHGPSGTPVPLPVGATDVELVVPATGHLQVKLENPPGFPETRAVWAVLRDLERDEVTRRWLISGGATNLRLRLGRYAVTCELNGREVAKLGEQLIQHNATTEVAVDLRDTTRVVRIEVLGPDRAPILPARVRVAGSPDQPFSRRRQRVDGRWRHVIALPVQRDVVDIELPYYVDPAGKPQLGVGPMKFVVRGVAGDCTLVLQRSAAAGEPWTLAEERPK